MILILWELGHDKRSKALAAVIGAQEGDINQKKPSRIAGLDTLILWGHGDAQKLCDKKPDQMFDIIAGWKGSNGSPRTVEILTCNARHSTHGESFVGKLKARVADTRATRGITIKALPVHVKGATNAWSILLAETQFNSWCYITASGADDKELMKASSLIQYQTNQNGGLVSYRGDIAKRADEMVRTQPALNRKWTMLYGPFRTLRAYLGTV